MSMTICEDRHEPVVYTDYDHRNQHHKCPVCEALDKVAELKEDLDSLVKRVSDLESELEEEIRRSEA